MKKLGIIGANGVAATNRLLDFVERKFTARGAFRDAHHPDMIVAQATQVPSRSMFLEGRGADWRPDYIEIAKMFKSVGCDLACMCCNTAHYAIDDVVAGSDLPFINLLDEVARRVATMGLPKVELWVSDGARKFDIYGPAFARQAPGCTIVYPPDERQKLVTKVICAVKTKARFLAEDDPAHPHAMIAALLKGAEAPVVFGCTDIRVAYRVDEPLDAGVALDSLECLADAIMARWALGRDEKVEC